MPVPPASVARAAAQGLRLRRMQVARGSRRPGGTEVGVARARDLKNRKNIPEATLKRMWSYFSRHAVDAEAAGWGDSEDPSPGWVAWLLWGGDEGREWVRKELGKPKSNPRALIHGQSYHPEDVYHAIRSVIKLGDPELAVCVIPEKYLRMWEPGESTGYCSAAAQAMYYLSGGKDAGFTPAVLRGDGWTHWWVEGPDGVVYDPTADQFDFEVPYEDGVRKGFQGRHVGGYQQPTKAAAPFVAAVIDELEG